MKTASIRNSSYKDDLARKRRNKFLLITVSSVFLFVLLVSGSVYLLFFAGYFTVNDISINGLKTLDNAVLKAEVSAMLSDKFAGVIPRRNNVFIVNKKKIGETLYGNYSVIKNISAERNGLHGISVNIEERTPVGTWCLKSNNCRYFDDSGVSWGEAVRSSGFLFLNVDDLRDGVNGLDMEFLPSIRKVTGSINVTSVAVRQVVIPADSFRDFRVETSGGYDILFATDSDIKEQLNLLKIFLDTKSGDTSFKPSYIDLRINGRIYFKNQNLSQ